jgi:hypothetical protein
VKQRIFFTDRDRGFTTPPIYSTGKIDWVLQLGPEVVIGRGKTNMRQKIAMAKQSVMRDRHHISQRIKR